MEMKHTPGPWRVGSYGPNGCYTVGTNGGLMTAMVAHSVNYPEQINQAIADAKLIAAAPDLLQALYNMLEDGDATDRQQSLAAIKKATE